MGSRKIVPSTAVKTPERRDIVNLVGLSRGWSTNLIIEDNSRQEREKEICSAARALGRKHPK
jgi:hypothetical protein